jgi:hypothetical protein
MLKTEYWPFGKNFASLNWHSNSCKASVIVKLYFYVDHNVTRWGSDYHWWNSTYKHASEIPYV